MSTERNKQQFREFIERVWNQGDLEQIREYVTADYKYSDPITGEQHGAEAFRAIVDRYRTAFPDLRFSIEEQTAEGDRVVTRWTGRGTYRGELMGIEPTNQPGTNHGISVERFKDGKLHETWAVWDTLDFMHQLGIVDEMEALAG